MLIPMSLVNSGEAVSEGFALLQSIYDKHNIPGTTANDWVVQRAVVRQSPHAPYQFILSDSRVLIEERNGVVRKDLFLSGIPMCNSDGRLCSIYDMQKWRDCRPK